MSGPSICQLFGGPAIVTYRGSTFYSKGDITLEVAPATFPIETDVYAAVDFRVRAQPIKCRFVPAGKWGDLNVLYDYAKRVPGDMVTPARTLGVIVSNVVTCMNNLLQSGDSGYVTNVGGALPTGLSAGTLYYIHVVSGDAITFHTNRADAITGANQIAVSGGTGLNRLAINNPLTIQTIDPSNGRLITLYNAAVTRMPNINATATATLLEEVEFEAFLIDGKAPSDTQSLYSNITSPYQGDTSFVTSQILTQPINVSWGNTAPWSSFYTKTGVRVEFALALTDVDVDGYGVITKRLSDLTVSARMIPIGVDTNDLMTALQLQGSGAGIGRSLSANGNNLNLSAPGFYCRLYQAGLVGGPELFARNKDRIGEILFMATRSFNNGIPNPLFWVGTTSLS